MRRFFLIPALLAAGLAGCGESGNDLLPERTGARMVEFVDTVDASMSQDPPRCQDAQNAAQAGRRRAEGLPSRVDEDLKENLIAWFEHLEDEARKECIERNRPEETATPDATETPEATETPDPTPTPDETEEPEETPTAEPTPTATEAPPENEEQGFAEEEEG